MVYLRLKIVFRKMYWQLRLLSQVFYFVLFLWFGINNGLFDSARVRTWSRKTTRWEGTLHEAEEDPFDKGGV